MCVCVLAMLPMSGLAMLPACRMTAFRSSFCLFGCPRLGQHMDHVSDGRTAFARILLYSRYQSGTSPHKSDKSGAASICPVWTVLHRSRLLTVTPATEHSPNSRALHGTSALLSERRLPVELQRVVHGIAAPAGGGLKVPGGLAVRHRRIMPA